MLFVPTFAPGWYYWNNMSKAPVGPHMTKDEAEKYSEVEHDS